MLTRSPLSISSTAEVASPRFLASRVKAGFSPVAGSQPATEIIEQVRSRLRLQELRAGDRLPTERELSTQFGVSRNSVRQALRSMQEQGLLEIRKGPSGGAVIRDHGAGSVATVLSDLFALGTIRPQDLTEMRVLVGTEVVRLACARASEAEFDRLEANVAAAEEAVRENDLARRTELNLEFHKLLARMTGNALLVAVADAVVGITGQFVSAIERTPNRYVMPFRRRLLRQLRARDAAAATDEMRRHLQRQEVLYLKAHARMQKSR
ncbi:FadR/GntR family transcriptional regulator [Variovorax sp. PBL-E5]|uniref:FadR/GntR family transcriptional regulator n=1 Tax=Variovorax sp. PBL-E5 TaxID=434014 RepID=UPI0013197AB3|nr:FCD domain-containing protein [Variovorax sp. PBL-E5]VTU30748.1 Putative L-lactate dehydrogenase operon regulatory protein [Variovorax sp. PBL-E5]